MIGGRFRVRHKQCRRTTSVSDPVRRFCNGHHPTSPRSGTPQRVGRKDRADRHLCRGFIAIRRIASNTDRLRDHCI